MSDFLWSIPDTVSIPASTSTTPQQIDHVAEGLARLPEQWKRSQNLIDLLSIFLARYNGLEQTFMDLLLKRDLYSANADMPSSTSGAQLDLIGKLVGQPRNGLTNDDYRRYIAAQISTNNSDGTVEDLIAIARLVLNDVNSLVDVETLGIAACEVIITGITVNNNIAGILISFLRRAHAAGVKLTQRTDPDTAANGFTFDSMSFLDAPAAIGDVTISTGDNMLGFPASGSITIDTAGNAETVTYSFLGDVGGSDVRTSPLTKVHSSGVQVLLVGAPGKGFGDSTEGGHPTLTAYANIGTTGGRLQDARE